jgi:hypothetical protein
LLNIGGFGLIRPKSTALLGAVMEGREGLVGVGGVDARVGGVSEFWPVGWIQGHGGEKAQEC